MDIMSFILFLLVLLFVEFCVFCYFTPNLKEVFTGKKDYSINDYDEDDFIDQENNSFMSFPEQEWETDELLDDEIKPLTFPDEEWQDDSIEVDIDEVNKLLFEIDPDFKIDQFYLSIYDLYSNIANCYSDDNLKDIAGFMSKELYQENVRQLDSFRKRNLQHVVQVKNFINCSILDAKIIERNLYIKVELKVDCYDYIKNRNTGKTVKGISNKPLYCVYHLILTRKLTPLHFSKLSNKHAVIPSVTNSSDLNDDKWILSANKIMRRRIK